MLFVGKIKQGISVEEQMKDNKYYSYYLEAYTAIFKEFIGPYSIETVAEDGTKSFTDKYRYQGIFTNC